jgi:triosephosphate isomerase
MKRYVIGNWKCYKKTEDARRWLDTFASLYRPSPQLEVVLAPSFICLESLSAYLQHLQIKQLSLATQDISPYPKGAYTGAIAADMVRGMAEYVIVGHSERRRYFHESIQDAVNKVHEAVDFGLRPILCLEQSYAMSQLAPLTDIDCEKMIIAYCPVDALTFRIPESPDRVTEAIRFISEMHPNRAIVYGGSINTENAEDYLGIPGLAGLIVGAASLDPESFVEICNMAGDA